ncbi:MAG TPA: tetratricopeptide repeat protein [Alphaproteobacteria bacterium]|nr:tetratricopeptide repeat protein [Alphaproteobacteria bacterium]
MAEERVQRRLAAILAADVVGYSRLMELDEAGSMAALKARRKEVLEPLVARHQGRIFKVIGDGVLLEFASAVNAVQCAIDLQHDMAAANVGESEDRHIVLRIGVNLGDVMIEGSDLYGEGVNIAARLEALAEPGGIIISGTTYDYIRNKVKVGFDDLGNQTLKNITEPIRAYRVASTPTVAFTVSKPVSDKPFIAVLPFTNMSGDPEQEYFSDGITEDIITELSRFRSLFVIARHSSFAFKGKAVTVQQVGRELGVEYVLEGSVRRAGNRVRITAQLIDARTGAHIWAERLDRDMGDLFAMQDEVTERIVATIASRLEKTEQERAVRKRPEETRAYDYVLRAQAIVSETAETNQQSRALYEKALTLEPTNIRALTGLAWTHVIDWSSRWSGPVNDDLERADKLARQAQALDSTDYRVHQLLGQIQMHRKAYAEALMHFQQAIALNANDANGAAHLGGVLIAMGRFSEALDWLQRAVRLNPLHPAWYLYAIGEAHYGARQYEKAVAPLRVAVHRFPTFITPRRHLAAVYAQMGRLDEARAEVAAIRRFDPSVCLAMYRERIRYEKVEDRDHYLDGLRKAGLPE